ncbi:MAG TPA: hypothetical protein VGF08_08915, partial [Terriglobales bacterium]
MPYDKGMMHTTISPHDCGYRPCRTRQEAAELLRALRAAYRSLSSGERGLVKTVISQVASAQSTTEL